MLNALPALLGHQDEQTKLQLVHAQCGRFALRHMKANCVTCNPVCVCVAVKNRCMSIPDCRMIAADG